MLLTDQLLLNYQRCNRRAFLDIYGDLRQKAPLSDFLVKLSQDSLQYQQLVLENQDWLQPDYPRGDWVAGAEATLELMQQGVAQIHQGVLRVETEAGITLVSNPDLLTKQPGLSIFGDWIYVPTDIKLSKRSKLEYQLVLTFHVYLLATIQGAWPETAWLFLREKGFAAVDLWQTLPQMQQVLQDLVTTLQQQQEPEVFIVRNRCSLCSWFNHCYAIAQTQQHLSLVPGVTPSRYPILQQLNLTTVEALAATDPASLESLPGFGPEVATRLVQQAQAVVKNQAIALAPVESPPFPAAAVELYFDIEAEPALNLAYLHGVLVVDRQAQTQTFYPLLAERPEDERLAWEQFLELVHAHPQAPIFHFCAYEAQTVARLAKLYQTPGQLVDPLLSRFIDLHHWVTRTVTLPIESYTLKLIARWLGFQWRNPEANGAQAIYWYTQWLQTGDRQFLRAILDYNEDDCRATHHLKNWLTDFMAPESGNGQRPESYQF